MRSWIDPFIPPVLRTDAESLRRARLMGLLSAVLMTVAVLYSLFYGLVVRFPAGAIITGGGAAVAAVMLVLLRAWPRQRAGGHALTCVLYCVLVSLVYHTGGLPSFVMPWLIMPPMFAALLLGRRGAAVWTVLSVLTVAAYYLGARSGMRFPVGYGAEWSTTINFVSFGGLVASTAILVWVFEDIRIAAQARAEAASAALARLAYHDALTGLTNRARFLECLGDSLARAHAAGDPARVAVLLLDLDGFKMVNDSLGHGAGDTLLAEVAARLLNATRGCDTVARLGGDEFAVLLDGVRDDASTAIVADRIVTALAAPYTLDDGRQALVSTSLGIARGVTVPDMPGASDQLDGALAASDRASSPRSDVAAVLHDADVAMYRAKALGKGRWVRFEAGMHTAPTRPSLPVLDLRCGLGQRPLDLAYPGC